MYTQVNFSLLHEIIGHERRHSDLINHTSHLFAPSMTMYQKFPSTPHLVALQSLSSDDKLVTKEQENLVYHHHITVEEKIDGAQLSIGWNKSTSTFVLHNRSKEITSASSSQWKGIDTFLKENHDDLYSLLKDGNTTLCGEWLAAEHSIHYTNLPSSYFVAFDIKKTPHESHGQEDIFLSRRLFWKLIKPTRLVHVPVLFHGVIADQKTLLRLLQQRSTYAPEKQQEGIYIRVDNVDNTRLKLRCKVVNKDFIQTIEDSGHWSSKVMVKNIKTDSSTFIMQNQLIVKHGSLYIMGPGLDYMASLHLQDNCRRDLISKQAQEDRFKRDGPHYHITVQYKGYEGGKEMEPSESIYMEDIIELGLGHKDNAHYMMLLWKDQVYHMTLGFIGQDVHDKPKGISTIAIWTCTEEKVALIKSLTIVQQCLQALHIHPQSYNNRFLIRAFERRQIELLFEAKDYAQVTSLCIDEVCHPRSENHSTNNAERMLLTMRMLSHELLHDYELAYLDCVSLLDMIDQKNRPDQVTYLKDKQLHLLKRLAVKWTPEERHEVFIDRNEPRIILPRYTSWIEPGKVLATSLPKRADQLQWMALYGIRKIYHIMNEEKQLLTHPLIEIVDVPCDNFRAPRIEEIHKVILDICATIEKGSAISLNCGGGKGRCGTMVACWFIYHKKMTPANAIKYIRSLRSLSIETEHQEKAIHEYYNWLIKTQIIPLPKASWFIMLVGLPGSGKSTFCDQVKDNFIIINQDTDGHRNACREKLMSNINTSPCILDRCNLKAQDRAEWLTCIPKHRKIMTIYFATPHEECITRAIARVGHPNIHAKNALRIITEFATTMDIPSLKTEPGLKNIVTISNQMDIDTLIASWNA
jgi:atypical dual specificity phosphatase